MAITYTLTEVERVFAPQNNVIRATAAVAGTYSAGGDVVTVGTQLRTYDEEFDEVLEIDVKNPQGYQWEYIRGASNGVDLGKLKVYRGDYDLGADGAFVEVTAGVDLSALSALRLEIRVS